MSSKPSRKKGKGKQTVNAAGSSYSGRDSAIKNPVVRSRELFTSDATDTYPVNALRGKCRVVHYQDIYSAKDFHPSQDSFFYVLKYNPETKRLATTQGEIRVGSSHQARLPECKPDVTPPDMPESCDKLEDLRWQPSCVMDGDLVMYLRAARSIAAFAGMCDGGSTEDGCQAASMDETTTNSMDILHYHKYDTGKALQALVKSPALRSIEKKWTDEDTKRFVKGLRQYGKNFFKIRKELLPHRETGDLVEYYYFWKKTPAAASNRPHRRHRRQGHKRQTTRSSNLPIGDYLDQSSASECSDNESDDSDGRRDLNTYACRHCFTRTSKDWHHAGKDKTLLCTECRVFFKKYGEERPIDSPREPPPFLFKPVKDDEEQVNGKHNMRTRRSNNSAGNKGKKKERQSTSSPDNIDSPFNGSLSLSKASGRKSPSAASTCSNSSTDNKEKRRNKRYTDSPLRGRKRQQISDYEEKLSKKKKRQERSDSDSISDSSSGSGNDEIGNDGDLEENNQDDLSSSSPSTTPSPIDNDYKFQKDFVKPEAQLPVQSPSHQLTILPQLTETHPHLYPLIPPTLTANRFHPAGHSGVTSPQSHSEFSSPIPNPVVQPAEENEEKPLVPPISVPLPGFPPPYHSPLSQAPIHPPVPGLVPIKREPVSPPATKTWEEETVKRDIELPDSINQPSLDIKPAVCQSMDVRLESREEATTQSHPKPEEPSSLLSPVPISGPVRTSTPNQIPAPTVLPLLSNQSPLEGPAITPNPIVSEGDILFNPPRPEMEMRSLQKEEEVSSDSDRGTPSPGPDPTPCNKESHKSDTAIFIQILNRGSNSCSRCDLIFRPLPDSKLAKKREERERKASQPSQVKEEKGVKRPETPPPPPRVNSVEAHITSNSSQSQHTPYAERHTPRPAYTDTPALRQLSEYARPHTMCQDVPRSVPYSLSSLPHHIDPLMSYRLAMYAPGSRERLELELERDKRERDARERELRERELREMELREKMKAEMEMKPPGLERLVPHGASPIDPHWLELQRRYGYPQAAQLVAAPGSSNVSNPHMPDILQTDHMTGRMIYQIYAQRLTNEHFYMQRVTNECYLRSKQDRSVVDPSHLVYQFSRADPMSGVPGPSGAAAAAAAAAAASNHTLQQLSHGVGPPILPGSREQELLQRELYNRAYMDPTLAHQLSAQAAAHHDALQRQLAMERDRYGATGHLPH